MSTYRNGYLPASRLVWFWARNQYGKLERFRATEATVARWRALVADVRANEGFELTITSGPNVYRDYGQQVDMRAKHGDGAATPGYSSHGGTFEGRDSLAIDVNNWARLGKRKFYRYARKHGFTPGMISRARGYARTEHWHIIDFNPYTVPAPSGGSTLPIPPQEKDEEMALKGIYYKTGKTYYVALFDSTSGFFSGYNTTTPSYNNKLAKALKTGNYAPVTKSHYGAIERDCAKLRTNAK